jgi:type IV secretory pathway protease TraF
MRIHKRRAAIVGFAVITTLVICVLLRASNIRVNITGSHVPVGLWKAYPVDNINVGDVISFSIKDLYAKDAKLKEDSLSTLYPIHIKIVSALPGELIERSGDQIIAAGKVMPGAIIAREELCKVKYPLVIENNTLWLMSDSKYSYDSRYYGAIPKELIREKLFPVLTFGSKHE